MNLPRNNNQLNAVFDLLESDTPFRDEMERITQRNRRIFGLTPRGWAAQSMVAGDAHGEGRE